jgi:hypothetical protein
MPSKLNKRKIEIKGQEINYILKKRKGVRSVRLAIYGDGCFVVSAPKWYPLYVIERFMAEKAEWILERLKIINLDFWQNQKEEEKFYKKNKEIIREQFRVKLEYFNQFYGFSWKRIAVRRQRTCWGSCSRKGNLNFNYKIIKLPEELMNYVIVHELCHLQELNHSQKFWKLVEKTIPEYKIARKKLKNLSRTFL